jgi:hypothetical protein
MSDTPAPSEHHPEAVQVRADLAALSLLLFAALEHGIESARSYFADRALDPWLFPHIVRDKVLEQLSNQGGDFSLTRNPMAGVLIESQGYHVRLFKKSGEEAEFLYPVGHSQGRQAFYNQQLVLPGMSELMEPVAPSRPNVAYVWEPQSDGLELTLVCPDGFEGIWKPGMVRWSIDIPHPALSMTSDTVFESVEEGDLPITFDEAASGSDDEA